MIRGGVLRGNIGRIKETVYTIMGKIKEFFSSGIIVKWFAVLCVASLLCSTTPYTYFLYNPLLMASLAVGGVLLLWLFFVDRRVYTRPYAVFFLVFCVSYGVTILLNRNSGFMTNCGQLVYTGFYFFIFFCTFSSLRSEIRTDTLKILSWLILAFSVAVAVASLGMMVTLYSGEIEHLGSKITVGFIHRSDSMQLFGAATGPSSLGQLSLAGAFSAWYLFRKPNGVPRWPCVVFCVIFWLTIAAANAYSMLIIMVAFAFFFVVCNACGRSAAGGSGKKILRVAGVAVRVVLVCAITVGCYFGTQTLESATINEVQMIVYHNDKNSENGTDGPAELPPEVTIIRDLNTSATGSRRAIWKEGIQLFLSHPLGVTNSNISVKVFYGVPDYEFRNLHNGYLTLLVASGIVGFLAVMSFGVLFFLRAMRYLRKCADRDKRWRLAYLISICAAVLAGELVNGCFVLWRGLEYGMLWLLLGQICALITEKEPKESDEKITTAE